MLSTVMYRSADDWLLYLQVNGIWVPTGAITCEGVTSISIPNTSFIVVFVLTGVGNKYARKVLSKVTGLSCIIFASTFICIKVMITMKSVIYLYSWLIATNYKTNIHNTYLDIIINLCANYLKILNINKWHLVYININIYIIE